MCLANGAFILLSCRPAWTVEPSTLHLPLPPCLHAFIHASLDGYSPHRTKVQEALIRHLLGGSAIIPTWMGCRSSDTEKGSIRGLISCRPFTYIGPCHERASSSLVEVRKAVGPRGQSTPPLRICSHGSCPRWYSTPPRIRPWLGPTHPRGAILRTPPHGGHSILVTGPPMQTLGATAVLS